MTELWCVSRTVTDIDRHIKPFKRRMGKEKRAHLSNCLHHYSPDWFVQLFDNPSDYLQAVTQCTGSSVPGYFILEKIGYAYTLFKTALKARPPLSDPPAVETPPVIVRPLFVKPFRI